MKVVVVGSGYVGLVTGACLAEIGSRVVCVDIDQKKIEGLKEGIIPIYEPGLEELVKRNQKEKRLSFTTDLGTALHLADVVFIAVGTPPNEDGSADLHYVLDVAAEIGAKMQDYLVVVTKSTVPVGTSQKVKETIMKQLRARQMDLKFDIASNPEFLKEGVAIQDFMRPDRIVVGVESEQAEKLLKTLYQPFVLNGHPLMFMTIPSAELTKYTANAMLATRISFMNDIANVCDLVGADINEVRRGIASDPRIGNKFLYSGVGYGGSCFPKDVNALITTGKEKGHHLRILESVEAVNEDQKQVLFHKMKHYFKGHLKDKIIAIWGLTFKPNTDDMRQAPSLVVIDHLLSEGAKIRVFDPVGMPTIRQSYADQLYFAEDIYDASKGADAIALVTEWNEFKLPRWGKIAQQMRNKVVFDGRNIYDRQHLEELGFYYAGIGQ